MNNVNYDYVRVAIEANHLELIIDEFTPYFKAYKLSGHSSSIKISGYITEHNFLRLSEEAKHYATVKLDLEELITC